MARVLVIDDLATMRELIRRVLRGSGYEVDVAATVAQAQALEPVGYDVLLIDEHLGHDRGTDLIASLADQDPDIPARCVLISGGLTGEVPAGTTVLAKPFDPAGLRELVGTVARGGSIGSQVGTGGVFSGDKDLRGLNPAAQAGPGGWPAGTRHQWRLADLICWVRAHDHAAIADLVHDGPAQELGASILALELIRRAVSAELAGRLDEVIGWLVTAAGSFRDLSAGPAQRVQAEGGLAGALPAQVRLVGQSHLGLGPSEQVAVLTIAELLIEAIARPGLTSEMTIGDHQALCLIELKISRDRTDGDYLAVLESAAAVFGGNAEKGPAEREWRVEIALPRSGQ